MTDISQLSGFAAIAYIVFKDLIIPIARKQIPAIQKQTEATIKHEHAMEEKRLEAELGYQKQVADAVSSIEKVLVANNERMGHIEADIKEIKTKIAPSKRKETRV